MPAIPDLHAVIQQERNTVGHYRIIPLLLAAVPAGQTRYVDFVVPDYTRGLDWLSALFCGGDQVETGDLVCAGKLLFGQIAQVAVPATAGDTSILIVGPMGVLLDASDGGALSEGFYLSFGTEATTAAGLNAGPPSISGARTWSNPDQELREYEIKRYSGQTLIGGGMCVVTVTLFTALEADVAADTSANLVSVAIPEPLTMVKGETLDVGGQSLVSGPMPPGARLRAGFRNNGASSKTVCGKLFCMFGGS
jgi:hypothetical protein